MKYKLPTKLNTRKHEATKQVFFRLPEDLINPFNETLKNSTLRPKDLVESMVRHCLDDLAQPTTVQLTSGVTLAEISEG